MKQNEHGRILAVAAKRHLAPVGGRRKGQSRVWLIDHGYWLVQIEFQPSGWSKGSYLNVGAHWLWRSEPGPISFDHNDRVEDFISFENSEQFEPEADRLAARAAEEALKLAGIFGSITEIAQVLTDLVMAGRIGRSVYHAAVAAGLAGEVSKSHALFKRVQTDFDDPVRSVASRLDRVLGNPDDYRAAVELSIAEQRSHNKLPACPNPFGSINLPYHR